MSGRWICPQNVHKILFLTPICFTLSDKIEGQTMQQTIDFIGFYEGWWSRGGLNP
jgi:hypothetical protein